VIMDGAGAQMSTVYPNTAVVQNLGHVDEYGAK
jgi:hypothetical protein